jgi:hypothetical protein
MGRFFSSETDWSIPLVAGPRNQDASDSSLAFSTQPSDDTIMARIRGSVDDGDLQKIAQLKIKD